MKNSKLEKQNNVLAKDNGDLYDELKKKEKSATVNEGAVKLLEKLLEYAPEELAAAKQAANERQEQERNRKRIHANNKVSQKIPEELCVKLLSNYTEEQNALKTDIEELEDKLSASAKNETDVDEFIRRIKQYIDVRELTREMCVQLIEGITIGATPGDKTGAREVHIYYKLLGKNCESENSLSI